MNYKVYDENVARQYNVPYRDPSIGTAMCIHIDRTNNAYWGVADPRSGDPSALGLLS